MAREQDYILNLDANTSKLDAAVDSSGQKIDELGNRGKASLELLDTASGGATSKLTGLASSFIGGKKRGEVFKHWAKGYESRTRGNGNWAVRCGSWGSHSELGYNHELLQG